MSPVTFKDRFIHVAGALTVDTVSQVLEASQPFITGELKGVNLGGVSEVDSAALALVVEWLRIARKLGIEIGFEQIPPVLLDLAQSSGFEEIVPTFHA